MQPESQQDEAWWSCQQHRLVQYHYQLFGPDFAAHFDQLWQDGTPRTVFQGRVEALLHQRLDSKGYFPGFRESCGDYARTVNSPKFWKPAVFGELIDDGVILTDKAVVFRCLWEVVSYWEWVDEVQWNLRSSSRWRWWPRIDIDVVFAGVLLVEEEDDIMSHDWMVEGILPACDIKGAQCVIYKGLEAQSMIQKRVMSQSGLFR